MPCTRIAPARAHAMARGNGNGDASGMRLLARTRQPQLARKQGSRAKASRHRHRTAGQRAAYHEADVGKAETEGDGHGAFVASHTCIRTGTSPPSLPIRLCTRQ